MNTEIWSWAGIVKEVHQWLGTMVARRSQLLLLRKNFKEWFFKVASCCFYRYLTNSYNFYIYGQPLLFWSTLQRFPYTGCVSFFRDPVQVLTLFCFSVISSEWFFQTSCRLIRGLCSTWVIFADTLSGVVNPRENFSQTVCHHKRGNFSTWVVLTYKLFQLFN